MTTHKTHSPSPGDLHDHQVIALLRSGAHAALLSAYFGELEYRELSHLAKLAATRGNGRGPLVLILPGIMGSRLGSLRRKASSTLWLHPVAVAGGGLEQLAMPGSRSLRALGVMLPGYLKLRLSLEIAGFRAQFHPFDWRGDLDKLARALLRSIERSGENKVHIVGHSMGGLIGRLALALDKERRIARLVQLGAPNAGSYAPVQALRAVYPTVRKIAALDRSHSAEELAHKVFRTLPGLYQMLPAPQSPGEPDFFDPAAWPDDEFVPDPGMLARARQVRARMPQSDDRCRVIAGFGQDTIVSAAPGAGGLEYTIRSEGDGTVSLSRAQWPGAPTWFAAENHGALTLNNVVLAALADILRSGETQQLSTRPGNSSTSIVRCTTDRELRAAAVRKVHWEMLSLDSRRRILEPVISAEFM